MRDDEYVILVNGDTLMSSRTHGSEEALATVACRRVQSAERPRVLVGGLGMGFTLRAALDLLPPDAIVTVAELVAAVVAWNRGPLGALAGHPLNDPRVRIKTREDVGDTLRMNLGRFDAILLDVDNGPAAFTESANHGLYNNAGVAAAFAALRVGGALVVWSAWEDRKFEPYYNLVCKAGKGVPSSYSFCMCPGGTIVASTHAPGLLCTNGMSNSKHSSAWASAALVTTFGPDEYGAGSFAGVDFQETLERRFFEAGGGDYTAPAQTADDFLAGRPTARLRHSTYTFGTCPGRIDALLPPMARDAIARSLLKYERQIPGFSSEAGLLVGLESRSSGPIRQPRDRDTLVADGFDNLYPIGEGAGYAGGIMSAAIDGARSALRYLQR